MASWIPALSSPGDETRRRSMKPSNTGEPHRLDPEFGHDEFWRLAFSLKIHGYDEHEIEYPEDASGVCVESEGEDSKLASEGVHTLRTRRVTFS